MKIAFVSDAAYPWNVGGLEAIECTEVQELAKMHDVHFFSLKWPGMKKDFVHNGIKYHTHHDITVAKFYRHGRRSIREAIVYTLGLSRIFFYRFDYIQANEFPILHLPLLKLYCKMTGCKLIIDVLEVWDEKYWTTYLGGVWGRFGNSFALWALRGADAYIANSSATAQRLESLSGIEKDRINIFSPVINNEELDSIKRGKGEKCVIFSGRLIKEKRLDKWLEAIKAASKHVKGMRAVIIGDGPEKANIARLIKKLGLSGIVELRDFYRTEKKEEVYQRISNSKLLLHMSEREGLSVIVLESLALGTPVLLPEYSPIPNEVRNMCVVTDEVNVPYMLEEMLQSKDKSKYLRNIEGLKNFSVSHTNKFYMGLFNKLRRK